MSRETGTVYLVGAGPGDRDLITVKGRRLIESCDVLVYDYLVDEGMKAWVKPGCDLRYVGKQAGRHSMEQSAIQALLVEQARSGRTVVRLKGGDPFIFGRGGEEAAALREAGIRFELVPGVTAATGCAAYSGIPLTHREWSSAVTFISGHEMPGKGLSLVDWERHAGSGATLVLYMAMGRLTEICDRLVEGGRDGSTPAAVIQWGTTSRQRTVTATLATLPAAVEKADMGPPAVIIIGEVARMGTVSSWFLPGGEA